MRKLSSCLTRSSSALWPLYAEAANVPESLSWTIIPTVLPSYCTKPSFDMTACFYTMHRGYTIDKEVEYQLGKPKVPSANSNCVASIFLDCFYMKHSKCMPWLYTWVSHYQKEENIWTWPYCCCQITPASTLYSRHSQKYPEAPNQRVQLTAFRLRRLSSLHLSMLRTPCFKYSSGLNLPRSSPNKEWDTSQHFQARR